MAVRRVPAAELTDMGWEVYPHGLFEILVRLRKDYAPPRLLVTENGAAFSDPPSGFADPRRVEYLRSHVEAARQAIDAGVPLGGYFVWSLMDNFEWGQGLSRRFGLFHVDFQTQRRTPRDSARWYRDTITSGSAEAAVTHPNTRRLP